METPAIDTSTRAPAGDEAMPDRPKRRCHGRPQSPAHRPHALSVGLLGDSAGYLAVAIRTSTLDDPALVQDSVRTLNMFSLVFGIPLSIAALLTGVALGIGTRWGVFRYPWVVTKLLLVVTVMLVGGFVLNPASNQMLDGDGDATNRLIAGAAYDVVARPRRPRWVSSNPGGHSDVARSRVDATPQTFAAGLVMALSMVLGGRALTARARVCER